MQQVLTARQRGLVDLADRLAGRAAGHDRDNTFPKENDDMREAGILQLTG